MKNLFLFFLVCILLQCGNERSSEQNRSSQELVMEGKLLAQKYCTSCHTFADPKALSKQIWESAVLPNMGRRLGMERHSIMRDYPQLPPSIRPAEQQLSQQEWNKIVYYYRQQAPGNLKTEKRTHPEVAEAGFEVSKLPVNTQVSAVISYLDIDSESKQVVIGDALANKLLFFDHDGNLVREVETSSPPVALHRMDGAYFVTSIGIMSPNDQQKGRIERYSFGDSQPVIVLDSLMRPVFSDFYDFDRDGRTDIIVCEYGNNFGQLSLFYQKRDGSFNKKTLINKAGALKTIVTDFNEDGKEDILALFAQGDERVEVFLNQGSRQFRKKTLLRFPPHYGSYDLHFADINNDGNKEILYINGDNADYSRILKPYHGLRIFMRSGSTRFQQKYFFPMHGASKLTLLDYDRDGDRDIGITSTFPGRGEQAEAGVIVLENSSMGKDLAFKAYQADQSVGKQWTLISSGDIDGDGYKEILAGSMDLESYTAFQWKGTVYKDSGNSVLLLSNLGAPK